MTFLCSVQEIIIDHDKKLLAVLDRCQVKGIKLNSEKMQFRRSQVNYMGHLITVPGLQIDPHKVKDIQDMPQPTDKQAVQRILGMANYVKKFAPNLAEMAKNPSRSYQERHCFCMGGTSTWKVSQRDQANPHPSTRSEVL